MDCALVSSYYLNMVLGHKGCLKIMNSFLVPCLDCVSTYRLLMSTNNDKGQNTKTTPEVWVYDINYQNKPFKYI